MFLGKVVTDGRAVGVIDIIERVNTCDLNSLTPTLIIGKRKAEDIYGSERIKVLNKNIEGNIYWTYAKNERRDDYNNGVKSFNEIVMSQIKKKIVYKYINVFTLKYSTLKAFILFLRNKKPKYIYYTPNELYMYVDNSVYGLDIRECEYIGIKPTKLIEFIKTHTCNGIFFSNTDFITSTIQEYIKNETYLIPYFYYLMH